MHLSTPPQKKIFAISDASRSIQKEFSCALEEYRSIVEISRDILGKYLVLKAQLIFWMESARYFIVQLDVWNRNEDLQRYDGAVKRVQESFEHLDALINQLMKEVYRRNDEE